MECFDTSLALHALIGASLIIAGANLMARGEKVTRGYGAYCFALGYFIIGIAAAGRDVGRLHLTSRRYILGLGSATMIVASTFMEHYHAQQKIRQLLNKNDEQSMPLSNMLPKISQSLMYIGFAGLTITIAVRDDGSTNLVKGSLALGAFLMIGYTRSRLLDSMVSGQAVQKHRIAHMLSWGLLVLAISYSC